MSMLIKSDDNFITSITVRKSDEYSQLVMLKFERHYVPEEVRACNEMFLSTEDLRELGKFLTKQARIIESEQMKKIQ